MLTVEKFKNVRISNRKVAIISHNDLDGAGPILIGDKIFSDYKYFTVSNNSVDKVVRLVLFSPDYNDRDLIFITDVSITDGNLSDTISIINREGKKQIFLFDHHDTATWLNTFDWAHVTQEKGVSGTKLFWNFLHECDMLNSEIYYDLNELVDIISDWDTWQWVEKMDERCKDMDTLFKKTGINYFLTKFRNSNELFTDLDNAFFSDIRTKESFVIVPGIKKTAANINMDFDYNDSNGNHIHHKALVKCVSVAEAPGDIAEQLYDLEEPTDFVFIFYSNGTLSARSRVDDVHLGEWCKYVAGGGGHLRSAGFTLNKDTLWIYIAYLNKRYDIDYCRLHE